MIGGTLSEVEVGAPVGEPGGGQDVIVRLRHVLTEDANEPVHLPKSQCYSLKSPLKQEEIHGEKIPPIYWSD